jgi:hypothetical protein
LSGAPHATQLDIWHALTRQLTVIANLAKMMESLKHCMLGNLQLLRPLATAPRKSSKVLTIIPEVKIFPFVITVFKILST